MLSYDPRVVGALESDAWVAYYRRDWPRFLRAAVTLVGHAFGLSRPATLYGALLVLRANMLWAPHPDNDPQGARRCMRRFYALVARRHGARFDVAEAARLEVEWWRVHREHGDREPLVAALAALWAHVHGVAVADVRPAAEHRAAAMALSDRWVAEGRDPAGTLVAEGRAELVRSYAELLGAVGR